MSMAHECDKCGVLFKSEPGCLTLGEVCIDEGKRTKDGSALLSTWSDVELCFKCSTPIILALKGAILGVNIDKLYGPKKRKRSSDIHGER
jgi:hypothetical protein